MAKQRRTPPKGTASEQGVAEPVIPGVTLLHTSGAPRSIPQAVRWPARAVTRR